MKLFFCPYCSDVVKMIHEKRFCNCKKCWGYIEDLLTEICDQGHVSKNALPIALNNYDIADAYRGWKRNGLSWFIRVWTMDIKNKEGVCRIKVEGK